MHWIVKKRVLILMLFVFLLVTMCGCQSSPERASVTSKNDGAFDTNVVQSAKETPNGESSYVVTSVDEFYSTDGTVKFQMNINEEVISAKMPVVEVSPHYLTEDDAKRVAEVLFPECVFYESRPDFEFQLSKQEIREYTERWTEYLNIENLITLYGEDKSGISESDIIYALKKSIEQLNADYPLADETYDELCKWTFQPDSLYSYTPQSLVGEDLSNDNEKISADVNLNGIPYRLCFSKRNQPDFKLNYIYAFPYTYISPVGIDSAIYRAILCRTEEPTQERIEQIKESAQKMLDQMNLGTWEIDECKLYSNEIGSATEYIIEMSAVPTFNGIPAIRRPQLANLKSETSFASNYYLTDATFRFSSEGKLLLFEMYSTIDISHVINENVATIPIESLLEKARDQLSLSDYNYYGVSGDLLEQLQKQAKEDFECNVEICKLEYGMLRVKAPDTDERYYYVPGIVLSGTVDYFGKKTGTLYEASGDTLYDSRIIPLIALNAVDGTVISLFNE